MTLPSLPAKGAPWYTYAQGLHNELTTGRLSDEELRAAFVPALPTAGSYTYNSDGTIATDPDGNAYTWNPDGTPATQTKGGVTRTFNWNPDATLASVS